MQTADITSFEEFRIGLTRIKSGLYQLVARSTLVRGQEVVSGEFRNPFGTNELDSIFSYAPSRSVQRGGETSRHSLDPIKEVGTELFFKLFRGRLETVYLDSLAMADKLGKGLRIRLLLTDTEALSLPWEFMFDPRRQDFVALSKQTPIVRERTGHEQREWVPAELPLRVLFVDADEELARIESKAEGSPNQVLLENDSADDPGDLAHKIESFEPHILHLAGSGLASQRAAKGFSSAEGLLRTTLDLLDLIRGSESLRAVFLNATPSDQLAAELTSMIPLCLGMRGEMSTEARLTFSEILYETIFSGRPLEAAMTNARQAVDWQQPGGREWGLPILYMQPPDGQLFRASDAGTDPHAEAMGLESGTSDQSYLAVLRRNLEALQQTRQQYSAVPAVVTRQIEELEQRIAELDSGSGPS